MIWSRVAIEVCGRPWGRKGAMRGVGKGSVLMSVVPDAGAGAFEDDQGLRRSLMTRLGGRERCRGASSVDNEEVG